MTQNIEERLADLKKRTEAAQKLQARAEVERDHARKTLAEEKERLEADFGVSSVGEAKELLKQREEELLRALDAAEAKLTEAGA